MASLKIERYCGQSRRRARTAGPLKTTGHRVPSLNGFKLELAASAPSIEPDGDGHNADDHPQRGERDAEPAVRTINLVVHPSRKTKDTHDRLVG